MVAVYYYSPIIQGILGDRGEKGETGERGLAVSQR